MRCMIPRSCRCSRIFHQIEGPWSDSVARDLDQPLASGESSRRRAIELSSLEEIAIDAIRVFMVSAYGLLLAVNAEQPRTSTQVRL
jgi:hypothetical protein